jgi:hypothetical protein
MKKSLLRNSGFMIGVFALCFTLTACDKDDDDDQQKTTYTLSATANGAQEVPAVTTTATGTVSGTYNSGTNALSYTVTWTGLSGAPTLMHFHGPALAGEIASPAVTITGFPATASGTYSGSATLTEAQEADLLAGKWYWNAHTAINGSGEIRGQVSVQ